MHVAQRVPCINRLSSSPLPGWGDAVERTETTDVAVHADVVEVVLGGLDFARVRLARVLHGENLALPELGVVVELSVHKQLSNTNTDYLDRRRVLILHKEVTLTTLPLRRRYQSSSRERNICNKITKFAPMMLCGHRCYRRGGARRSVPALTWILASTATTWPWGVSISGLISTCVASTARKSRYRAWISAAAWRGRSRSQAESLRAAESQASACRSETIKTVFSNMTILT